MDQILVYLPLFALFEFIFMHFIIAIHIFTLLFNFILFNLIYIPKSTRPLHFQRRKYYMKTISLDVSFDRRVISPPLTCIYSLLCVTNLRAVLVKQVKVYTIKINKYDKWQMEDKS